MNEPDTPTPFDPKPDAAAEHHSHTHNPPQSPEEAVSPFEEARAAAMSIEARAFDGPDYEGAPEESDAGSTPAVAPLPAAHGFSGGDALIPPTGRFRKGEWQHEFSGHKIAVELARVEADVRKILDERDPKRKRKFTSSRRWQELEEDVISMKFGGRMDENLLRELTRLVMQRNFLFSQLRFVAATRPTWNT